MMMLIISGILLSVVFGFSLSSYIVKHVFNWEGMQSNLSTIFIGFLITFAVMNVSVFVVWPPVLPI